MSPAAGRGETMSEVDFYKLERPVQDRFADATRGLGVPAPLLRVPPVDRRATYWAGAAALLVVGVGGLIAVGFGDLEHPWALSPPGLVAAYAAMTVGVLYCGLSALTVRHAHRNRPYRGGLYLFPVGVVDARRDPLIVHRLPELTEVAIAGNRLRVQAGSAAYAFDAASPEDAEEVQQALSEARTAYARALEKHNRREQAQLDPLVDSGFSSPFSPKLPIARRVPLWARLRIPLAVGVGAALGVGMSVARDALSEQRLFEQARQADTISAYRAYIARGGERDRVREVLLPRAELRRAREAGSLAAIERYIQEHPNSQIPKEIEEALHAALDAELAEVAQRESVTALRQLARRRAGYSYIEQPVRDAIAELYDEAFDGFRRAAAEGNAEVVPFVGALLDHAKEHGPEVSVRFVRRFPESLDKADAQVKRSAYYMGRVSIPSQYFSSEPASRREHKVGSALVKRLQEPFPEDILQFTLGPPVTDPPEEGWPQTDEPTLFIEHVPNLAGGYMSSKPRGVFVGVGMTFEVHFAIPGGDSLSFESSSWRTPDPRILKEDGATVADVYEDMIHPGYERFEREFLRYLFGAA